MQEGPPKGFRVDFFGIGAPRCGSTWLATILDEHPEVAVSRPKEPDFFVQRMDVFYPYANPRYLADWDWYRSCFAHARRGAKLGDFSINLFNNVHSAPQAIRRHFPEARFLLVLRDPVKRTYSHWWYHYGMHRHWGGLPESFADAIHHHGLVWRSRYGAQLAHWLRFFDPDRFHVVLDQDLRDDPARVARQAYRFIKVDEAFRPPSLDVRINASKSRRGLYGAAFRMATRIRDAGLGTLVDAAKRLPVERVLDRLDVKRAPPPAMDPEVAAELRRILHPDIELLERLIRRDLTAWKTGALDEGGPRRGRTTELEEQLRPTPMRPRAG